jgi:TfoX/Sxy family transcriptional regulator of competence genes
MEGCDPMNSSTDSDVLALLNLGPISCEWLHAVGIHTRDDLEATGAVEAYAMIRECGFPASTHLLYALEGALRGVRWNRMPQEIREELRGEARTRLRFARNLPRSSKE